MSRWERNWFTYLGKGKRVNEADGADDGELGAIDGGGR